MKLLLDENLPHDLRQLLLGHNPFTVAFLGWNGIRNGELLRLAAEHGFDAMLTKNSGVEYEQSLHKLPLSVVIIAAPSNAIEDIAPLVPALLAALESLPPRTLVHVP